MASTNQSPAYSKAHGIFLKASTTNEKIEALKEMIKECPKHKSSENMLANLKTRLKKLKEQKIKQKKSGKSSFKGIKKDDMQAIIIGQANAGKSSLLHLLTNAHPKISQFEFTTIESVIGMMSYASTSIQLIEVPAFQSNYYDKSLLNTADTIIILATNLEDIKEIKKEIKNSKLKSKTKIIVVFNKVDKLTITEQRKLSATLSSKKHNFILISTKTKQGIEELKEKIFQSFNKLRVYTKEPGKPKTKRPIILEPKATVKHVAEKILTGFSKRVKETKIWGPSSKFSGQKVGLTHKLKDLDVVEFRTK